MPRKKKIDYGEMSPGQRKMADKLVNEFNENAVLQGYEAGFAGIMHRCGAMPAVAAYDVDRCIDVMIEDCDMGLEEAWDAFSYNNLRVSCGEHGEAFVFFCFDDDGWKEEYDPPPTQFDEFDPAAALGHAQHYFCSSGMIAYDMGKCIEIIMQKDGLTSEEAESSLRKMMSSFEERDAPVFLELEEGYGPNHAQEACIKNLILDVEKLYKVKEKELINSLENAMNTNTPVSIDVLVYLAPARHSSSIADDYFDVLLLGEMIAPFCSNIDWEELHEKYRTTHIRFTLCPRDPVGLGTELGRYAQAVRSDRNELRASFNEDFENNIKHFNDLAECYVRNFEVSLIEDFEDEELEEVYADMRVKYKRWWDPSLENCRRTWIRRN